MHITLTNDFHNTEVRIRVAGLPVTLSESQTRRVRRVLCGMSNCKCGTVRGPQYLESERLSVEWEQDQQGGYRYRIERA